MFKPLTLYIGLRYLSTKRNNRFISFTSGISIIGIALGVTVLLTVLSIMNGFDETIRDKIFNNAHHLTIQDLRSPTQQTDWRALRENLLKQPHVLGVAPFLVSQALLTHTNASQPALLYGVTPGLETSVSSISNAVIQGNFELKPEKNGIVLSQALAHQLNASINTHITLYVPILNKSLLNIAPRSQTFEVIGIFETKGIGLDSTLAYIHLKDLQTLSQQRDYITGLRLKIAQLYKAPYLSNHLLEALPAHYFVDDWTTRYGSLTKAIALEKTIILWVLLLLITIAAFNLVSSLVMLVTEKQGEIAILRTLGMSHASILGIFMVQGSLIGLIGTLVGISGGYLLSLYISNLASTLSQWFHIQPFVGNAFIQTLPSKIQYSDFLQVGLISVGISILATIYPAWRATKTIPIEALRYE